MGVLEIYFYIGPRDILFYRLYLVATITFKLVLHAVGLVLAFLTRNIKVDILNDYRYNVAIIIASSIFMVVICIALPTLSIFVDVFNLVWGVLVLLVTFIYLGLTFIPKVCKLI